GTGDGSREVTTTKRAASRPRTQSGSRAGYLRSLGPGLITGASDDDPSGIATYAQAGAKFQYGLLWTALLTLPLMSTVQEICDRTALATGKSLGALASDRFKGWRVGLTALVGLLILANVLNIGADIAAVGQGMSLIHAGPATLWSAIAGVAITALVVAGSFDRITQVFKFLCLALLTYVVVLFFASPSWPDVVLHTLVPHGQFSKEYMLLFVAVLGTTISP